MSLLELGHGGDGVGQALIGDDQADGDLGGGDELQRELGDDAQRALGTDHQIQQGITGGGLGDRGAEFHHLAGGKHHSHGADIIAGGAVLDGPHAAGVGGDVAAQRGKLFTGIGGIQQPLLQGVLGQIVEQYAGLHGDSEVVGVIGEDLLHLHGADDHAAGDGGAGAGQSGARTAAGDRDVVLVADLHDGGDLLRAHGVNGHVGHPGAIDGHLVAGVVLIYVGAGVDAAGSDCL